MFAEMGRAWRMLLAMSLLILVSACAFRSGERMTYYALDYPYPGTDRVTTHASSETLMIYRFLLSPRVEIDSLVISDPKSTKPSYWPHRWQENPADMVTDLLLRDFRNSGMFETTVDQLSDARYRFALEGTIRDLRGILGEDKAKALLDTDVTLIDFNPPPGGQRIMMKKRYKIEVPSEDKTATEIVRAFGLAVKELSEKLRRDVGAVLGGRR